MSAKEYELEETNLLYALEDYPELRRLTLTGDSSMQDCMKEWSDTRMRWVKVAIIFDGEKPVAWCWLFNYRRNSRAVRSLALMMFVLPAYRKQGLGSELFKWSKEWSRKLKRPIAAFPWNSTSDKFYAKNKPTHTYDGFY